MKTPIELIEGVIKIVHDVLGTAEGYEKHVGEVLQEERVAIAERIAEFLTPGLKNAQPPVDLKTGAPVAQPVGPAQPAAFASVTVKANPILGSEN